MNISIDFISRLSGIILTMFVVFFVFPYSRFWGGLILLCLCILYSYVFSLSDVKFLKKGKEKKSIIKKGGYNDADKR